MTRGAALIFVLTAAFLTTPVAVSGATGAAVAEVAGTGAVRAEGSAGTARVGATPGESVMTPVTTKVTRRQDTQVQVSAITPQAPREPAAQVKISGVVANSGATTLTGLSIRLRFSRQPFATRTEMQSFADGGQILDQSRKTVLVDQLVASGQFPWEFVVTPAELGMYRFGVYPVTIELVDAAGQQLAAQRTFLPYAPKNQQVSRTKIAWALPIVDQPHRGDDSTFVDDGLRETVADDGRLGKILKIAETPSKGVSWFVDPAVLDDAQAMAKGYSLRTGTAADAATERKPGDQTTSRWLQRLRTALEKAPVSATPYADPDVAAITHHGLDTATGIALKQGAAVATELLGKDVGTATNWPVGGVIDRDALDVLAVGDVRTVLLTATALPPSTPLTYTPDAAATVDTVQKPVNVLLADPVLSQLIATTGTSGAGVTALTTQRFLAETAMISAERPAESRTVVAAPPRRWNPDPAFVTTLLKTAASAPWLKPVTLSSVKPSKTAVPRGDLVYTDKDQQAELSKAYLGVVRKLSNRAELTATVTKDHRRVFDTALLRVTSAAWRGRTGNANPLIKQIDSSVTTRTNAISVSSSEQRTVAGQNGVVPISIRNDLQNEEVTVGVRITSGDRKLLTIGEYESPVTISPGKTRPLDIPMVAHGGGQTTVKVQLTTASGVRYGLPVEVIVNTTGYGAIALVIVGAALAVMLAAVVLRILRRRSRRTAKGRGAGQRGPRAVPEPAQHREGPS
ncbi:DUF6049 family protein [Sphaerisporangium perillae]|uniref:DUF6049 family protein n=1 Tax=Sphaerisporangium perillae TaxID=2935860 RepID=UPI00200FBFC7|nr:DUF6049 family protein [Sphaerisporangium perillae]